MKPSINVAGRVPPAVSATPSAIWGFDRIKMYTDRAELICSESLLKPHCNGIVVTPSQGRYQARFKSKVEIFQPTMECLALLAEAFGHDVAVQVSYVETACDLPATSKRQALLRRNSFLASAKVLYQRQSVERCLHTYYYARRSIKPGERSPHVLAIYAHRPSKILNARPAEGALPCTHIEDRIGGSDVLEKVGIASLNDVILFDHEAYFEKHLRLYELPKCKAELGFLLTKVCGGKPDASDSALRKRASRWVEKYSMGVGPAKTFVMANALLGTPNLEKRLRRISFSEWLEHALSL